MASSASPDEDAQYAKIGRMAIYWTKVEDILDNIIWRYIGDTETGHIVTAQMGNKNRTEILLALAEVHEKRPHMVEHIRHATKLFDIVRLNRNDVVHAYAFEIDIQSKTIQVSKCLTRN